MLVSAHLEFSDDKKKVRVIFANGKKSAWYFTKDTVLQALCCAAMEPVNGCSLEPDDLTVFGEQILNTEELPEHGPNVEMVPVLLPHPLLPFLMQEAEIPMYNFPGTEVPTPKFARCWCGGGHWRFFYGKETSDAIYSTEGGLKMFEALVADDCFTEADGYNALQEMLNCNDFPAKEEDVAIMDSEN